MQTDTVTRLLLGGILACLIALVFQGLGSDEQGWGRYQVTAMRAGAPMLIRTDSVTGQVWKLELRGGDEIWRPFREPQEQGAGTSTAASESPPDERAPAAAPPPAPVAETPARTAPPAQTPARTELPPPPASVDEEIETYSKAALGSELPADIRTWAIGQLAEISDPRATSALLGALEAEDAPVVLAALEALAGRDDERIESALKKAAAHPDPSVQRAVAERLGGN